jgi:hypothetical protein
MGPTTVAYASFELMGFDFYAAVEVEVTYLGLPAKTYGPPENCYPEEPPEYEVRSIVFELDAPGMWAKPSRFDCTVDPKSKQFSFLAEFLDDQIYEQVCEFMSELRAERSYRRRRAY